MRGADIGCRAFHLSRLPYEQVSTSFVLGEGAGIKACWCVGGNATPRQCSVRRVDDVKRLAQRVRQKQSRRRGGECVYRCEGVGVAPSGGGRASLRCLAGSICDAESSWRASFNYCSSKSRIHNVLDQDLLLSVLLPMPYSSKCW